MNLQEFLKNHDFFAGFTAGELALVEGICKKKEFRPDQTIFKEGDEAAKMFLLVTGTVSLRKGIREITRIRPGALFGEMPLLDGGKRTTSAVALDETKLVEIPYSRLMEILLNQPETALKFYSSAAKQVSKRLRALLEEKGV